MQALPWVSQLHTPVSGDKCVLIQGEEHQQVSQVSTPRPSPRGTHVCEWVEWVLWACTHTREQPPRPPAHPPVVEVAEVLHIAEDDSLLAGHRRGHMGTAVQVPHVVALQELQAANEGLLGAQQLLDDRAGGRV